MTKRVRKLPAFLAEDGRPAGDLIIKLEQEDEEPVRKREGSSKKPCMSSFKRNLMKSRKERYVQMFQNEWLDNEEFQPWLKKVENDAFKSHCVWCKKDFQAKIQEIKRHMKTKRHQLVKAQCANASKYYGEPSRTQIKQETCVSPTAHIINILREPSSSNEDTNVAGIGHREPLNEGIFTNQDLAILTEQTEEKNKLLECAIGIHRDRLKVERESLNNSKQMLMVQERLLYILQNHLRATTKL